MTDYWEDLGASLASLMGDDWVSTTKPRDGQALLSSRSNDGLIAIVIAPGKRLRAVGVYPPAAYEALHAIGEPRPEEFSTATSGEVVSEQLFARQILNKIVTPYETELERVRVAMERHAEGALARYGTLLKLAKAAQVTGFDPGGPLHLGGEDPGWTGQVTVGGGGHTADITLRDLPAPIAGEVLRLLARWR